MKKRILSLIVIASVIHAQEHDGDVTALKGLLDPFKLVDLSHEMGVLGGVVEHLDSELLSKKIDQLELATLMAWRLKREKEITSYRYENRRKLEAALVKEFSGENGAIKKAADESAEQNKKEEEKSRLEELDASLSWTGSNPTEKSRVGRAYKQINAVRQKKDKINTANYDLVIKNQETVLSTLATELTEKILLMTNHGQAFTDSSKGDGLDLNAAKEKENYFYNLAKKPYVNTKEKVGKMGIALSEEDLENVARKHPKTAELVKGLEVAQKYAQEERDKILNPQEPAARINLMGDDIKENQNDQGALSQ